MKNKTYTFLGPAGPGQTIVIDPNLCRGCNACVNVCRRHVLLPNLEKGKPPIVQFPQDCWFDGYCVLFCPIPGAMKMVHPLSQRVGWKRKDTGEYFALPYLQAI